jgi:hypothetical protein
MGSKLSCASADLSGDPDGNGVSSAMVLVCLRVIDFTGAEEGNLQVIPDVQINT